jgi:hypothetical protein
MTETIEQNIKPWSLDDFCFGKPLGRGRYGRVFLAKETRTKNEYLFAIKVMATL